MFNFSIFKRDKEPNKVIKSCFLLESKTNSYLFNCANFTAVASKGGKDLTLCSGDIKIRVDFSKPGEEVSINGELFTSRDNLLERIAELLP